MEATITSVVTGGTVTGYTYGEIHELPVFSVEYYYHINPIVGIDSYTAYTGSISCKAGNQTVRGFAELGLGEQGVCAGVSYEF